MADVSLKVLYKYYSCFKVLGVLALVFQVELEGLPHLILSYPSGWHINKGYGPGGWQHKNVDVVQARYLPPPRPDVNYGGRPSLTKLAYGACCILKQIEFKTLTL